MDAHPKQLLKAALRIQAQYARRSQLPNVQLPEFGWDECRRLVSRIDRANVRRWHGARRKVAEQLRLELGCVRTMIEDQLQYLNAFLSPAQKVPTLGDLYGDLSALFVEFDEAAVDLRKRTVSVVTESIELEGIDLGPFAIVLDWGELGRSTSPRYRVIAREPRPAASKEDVVHPHVNDEQLCAGEGAILIRKALDQGRLLDFFQIVTHVLGNYNAGSAYVSLEIWDGPSCADCGAGMSSDEAYACCRCGRTLCMDCDASCPVCRESFCAECGANCTGCDSRCCEGCVDYCTDCGELFCTSCLTDERCARCHEHEKDEQAPGSGGSGLDGTPPGAGELDASAADEAGIGSGTEPAVYAGGLGQALVPA